jgi:recombination protein RecT
MANTELRSRVEAASTAVVAQTDASAGTPNSVTGYLMDPRTTRQISRLLGTEEMAERWLRIALTVCRQTPKLLACTPESFAGALMQCAQLKLEPGPPLGLAWILPYDKSVKVNGAWHKVPEAQFMLGYSGIVQLAQRSGQIANIFANAVCEGDEFGFDYLTGEKHHKPPTRGLRGKAIGFYCSAKYANGGEHFLYMTREEMVKHRDQFAAAKKFKNGPWYEDEALEASPLFDGMGRKTMVRLSRPYLPASPDFIQAIQADERVSRLEISSDRVVIDDESFEGLNLGGETPTAVDAETPALATAPTEVAGPPDLVIENFDEGTAEDESGTPNIFDAAPAPGHGS